MQNVKKDLDTFLGPKITPTTWMLNLNYLETTTESFGLVQKLTLRETDFNQFMRLRNQLVNAGENCGGEDKPVPSTYTSNVQRQGLTNETHKVAEVEDRANRKVCVTLLRYNVDEP